MFQDLNQVASFSCVYPYDFVFDIPLLQTELSIFLEGRRQWRFLSVVAKLLEKKKKKLFEKKPLPFTKYSIFLLSIAASS